jgi:hypothetical protein
MVSKDALRPFFAFASVGFPSGARGGSDLPSDPSGSQVGPDLHLRYEAAAGWTAFTVQAAARIGIQYALRQQQQESRKTFSIFFTEFCLTKPKKRCIIIL